MKRIAWKIGLFVVVWYVVVSELRLDPDTAFLATAGLFAGWWFALRLAAQAVGMMGPFTFGLLVQAVVWIGLLWWFAPSVFHAVPFVFHMLAVVLIALVGARARFLYEERRQKGQRFDPSEHSGLVLIVVFGGLFACMLALRQWGTLWPIVGYTLLLALPFFFGWRMAPLAAADRADARFGSADAFRNAGLSEDR